MNACPLSGHYEVFVTGRTLALYMGALYMGALYMGATTQNQMLIKAEN